MKKIIMAMITFILMAGLLLADSQDLPDLDVTFGYTGTVYPLKMEDNETAVAIVRHVGRTSWNLPIVGFQGFEHSDVMNYYDIPGRYVIPSQPVTVTSEKAGEVYYSKPNRLVLFFHDAEVRGEFTKVGEFDASGDFIKDVENNEVLDFYNVMIINVKR